MEFTRLLQDSRHLNARIRAGSQDNFFLPQLQRGLEQIEELSSQLAAKLAGREGQGEARAALFLASKGYDATRTAAQLRKISDLASSPVAMAAPVGAPLDADVETFLAGELDGLVVEMFGRAEGAAVKEIGDVVAERQRTAWQRSMGPILERQVGGEERAAATGRRMEASTAPLCAPKMAAYARVVRAFNDARLRGTSLCLPRAFEGALQSLEGHDPRGEMLLDCWRALQSILGSEEADNVFQTSDLSRAYRAEAPEEGRAWRAQLVRGSRKFLEAGYLRFVERTLAQYPRDALLGGKPSTAERVRAFCDIKLKRLPPAELASVEVVNGSAVWMVLFVLVRCGLLREALSMAQSMEYVLARSEPLFVSFLKAFVEQVTEGTGGAASSYASLVGQIRLEYSERLSASPTILQDPYKMALLKILGRCDLARKNAAKVIASSEDYLWLQLWLIQDPALEGSDPAAAYTLADLQRIITDLGPGHFDPKQGNPWLYFELLALVGLFEKAIEYLHWNGQNVDGVHFAIALMQAGTLRISTSPESAFVKQGGSSSSRVAAVNFGQLVCSHARTLVKGDILDAVNYLLLLSLARPPSTSPGQGPYDALCQDSLRDLILQSGDYGSLLGDMRHDGTVIPGSLAQYSRLLGLQDSRSFMEVLTSAAAAKCHREGRFREALQLYNLGNQYDRVMQVLCARLSHAFTAPYAALEFEELRRTAESILRYYTSQPHISSALTPGTLHTCSSLVGLLNLRRLEEEANWAAALQLLLGVELLPLEADISAIAAAADRARSLPEALTMILPELALLAMTVLVRRAGELKTYIGIDSARAGQFEKLSRMGRNLMTFVGMLKIRIPQDIFAQLTRMEIALH